MICAGCAHENRPGAKFCEECAAPLKRACASCGAELRPTARFCDECGTPVAGAARAPRPTQAADTRKVVTIVFADLVGSTALHERLDAESARRFMESYYAAMRGAVESHGGTVTQLLGDGVKAVFGIPRVAEDDAIRAVRAAVAMQQSFRALAEQQRGAVGKTGLRVAVNTGEVVANEEAEIIGDPVNVAARLQEQGGDGDVVVGESTHRLVATLVTLEPLGSFALKGRAEPVRAHRVVSLERPAGAAAAAFVGRDDEIARIGAVYDTAIAKPATGLVVLLGSPGLGKSRLIDEFARRCGDAALVVTAHCDAAGGATFAPLADALRECLGIEAAASGDALRAAIEAATPGDDADRARIAGGIAALLAGSPASPEETFFVVRRFLAALATERPVVLVIDDLHWAEPLLLDLVEHLVQWGVGVPLLVLVGARPELRDTRSSLATPGGLVADVVMLAGLDAGAAMRLAANVIGAADLPAAVAAKVLATSEGNPLFVGELVRMLVHEGALTQEGDRWTTGTALAALEMPPTIHALLAARIERLRPEERTVLERAAVVGRHFSRSAVAELLPRDVTDLDARLESLRRSELIERDAGWFLGDPVLRFHHVLIRDAAYRRLLKGTRAELHARFADWVEAKAGDAVEHEETIGWHLEQAHQHLHELGPIDAKGRVLGERASTHLAAAGRRALARDDLPLAASLLGRALDRLDADDPARAALALDWCEALLAAGDVGPAAAAIDELGRFIADSERLQAWHTCFAGQHRVLTAPSALHATADRVAAAAEALTSLGDAAGEAKAHFVYALALSRLGKVGGCEAALDRALAAARRAGDRRRANTVLAIAPLAALWGPSPVTRASGRCLDVVRVLRITQGAPAVEAVALSCQGVLEALRGRTEAARRMIASARKMVEELGITQRLLEVDVFSGLVELLEGDASAAERSLRGAYDGLRELGLGIDAARAAALLARALLAQDRVAEAEALSHESEALAGDDLKAAIAWRGVRAEALARRGEHAAAVSFASNAVEIAVATDALLDHADARLALAAALRAAGRGREADAEERRARELWEAKGATLLAERTTHAAASVAPSTAAAAPRAAHVPRRRPVRPNFAFEEMRRAEAAVATRDAQALEALYRPDVEIVDHQFGITYGHAAIVERVRAVIEDSTESVFAHEPLAALGDSLALCRMRSTASGSTAHGIPVGATEVPYVLLIEADEQGSARHIEIFGDDKLADAVVRLYERHAELLPEGPDRDRSATRAHAFGTMLVALNDLARTATALAPDFESLDHRHLSSWSLRGAGAFLDHLRALQQVAADVEIGVSDVLALEASAVLVRRMHLGTERVGGGTYERPFLVIFAAGADGRVARAEFFDADREAEALARFDALTAEPAQPRSVRRRVRPNGATRALARFDAACVARDVDAAAAVHRADFEETDHPTGSSYPLAGARDGLRRLLRAHDPYMAHEPLATLGESLALSRRSTGANASAGGRFDVGAWAREEWLVSEVDGDEHLVATEIFAADRLGDALVRLYERHAERMPAGPARERAASFARSIAAMESPPDATVRAGVFAPDIEMVDHRRIGTWSARGIDTVVRHFESIGDVSDEPHLDDLDVLALESGAVVVLRSHSGIGRQSGGAYERLFLMLLAGDADGRIARIEWFDADRQADALACFDSLAGDAAPTAPVRRRLSANAATAVDDRFVAAFAAGDLEAARACFGPNFEEIDHSIGSQLGHGATMTGLEYVFRSRDLVLENERLATLGASLLLARRHYRGSGFADDQFETGDWGHVQIAIEEADDQGRFVRAEIFAPDRLGEAVARLYERRAGQMPAGPERARAAATARSVAVVAPGGVDLDRYKAAFRTDTEVVNHQLLGWGTASGPQTLFRSMAAATEVADQLASRPLDVLALTHDALLLRWLASGVGRDSGGAFEWAFLRLFVFDAEGRVARYELFDSDHEGEALARFEELVGSGDAALREHPFANAASRANRRRTDCFNARDWAGVEACVSPDLVFDERRRLLHNEADRQVWLEQTRLLFDLPESRFTIELVATRGERLSLHRHEFEAQVADGGGPLAIDPHWSLHEVDRDGRIVGIVLFDLDVEDAAYADLDARFEADPSAAHGRVVVEFVRAIARRDWDAVAALCSPAFVEHDHRGLAVLGTTHGADAWMQNFRALVELAPDTIYRSAHVRTAARGFLSVGTWQGSRDGGRYEIPLIAVLEVDAQGGIARADIYDPDQLDSARARFEEVEAGAPSRFANTASRAEARMSDCWHARDWQGYARLCAPGFRFFDRRGLVQLELDRDQNLEFTRGLGDMGSAQLDFQILATRGDRLVLSRARIEVAGGDVGTSEVEHLNLLETDARGDLVAHVRFDAAALEAAYAELDARFGAGEGAEHPLAAKWLAGYLRHFAARDWDAMRALFAPDLVGHNHRLVGWGTLHGPAALVSTLEAQVALAPDTQERVDHVRICERGVLFEYAWHGTHEGGAFENVWLVLVELDDQGLARRADVWEAEQQAVARARFDALEAATNSRSRFANAATATSEPVIAALVAHDWAAFEALFADSFRCFDRRRMVQLDFDRAGYVAFTREVADGRAIRGASVVLATRGERLALVRSSFVFTDGDVGPSEISFLLVTEVDERGRIVAYVRFDDDDPDAWAELDARFDAGEGLERPLAAAWCSEFRRAFASRDWDAMFALQAPDQEAHDHRLVGWGTLRGAGAWTPTLQELVTLAPDVRQRVQDLRLCARGSLWRHEWYGTRDGGAFVSSLLLVVELDDRGRQRRLDVWDADRLDAALARFHEITAASAPEERFANAATRVFARGTDALAANDFEGFAALFAPDYRNVDHILHVEAGREEWLAGFRQMIEMTSPLSERDVIATRGERLALVRMLWRGAEGDVGPSEMEWLLIIEADERGDHRAVDNFDASALDAAYAELDARFAAGEGAAHPHALASHVASSAAIRSRDWDALAARCAPTFRMRDHRLLGWGTIVNDAATFVRVVRSAVELAPDSRYRDDHLRSCARGTLAGMALCGTRDGGPFENPFLRVTEVDEQGRVLSHDTYDERDFERALARFAEIAAAAAPEGRFENAASRAWRAVNDAWTARDLERFAAPHAAALRYRDHRRLFELDLDRAGFLDFTRPLLTMRAGDASLDLVATRGERLALMRSVMEMEDESVGSSVIESLMLIETDERGDIKTYDRWDLEDEDTAWDEIDARFDVGEGAAHARTLAAWRRWERAMATRDWDALGAMASSGFAFCDHRLLGWGTTMSDGASAAQLTKALVDLAPDVHRRHDHVRLCERGILEHLTWVGTRDGGAFENVCLAVYEWDAQGRVQATDNYDVDRFDLARARFAELENAPLQPRFANTAVEAAHGRFENTASRAWRAAIEAWRSRDVIRFEALQPRPLRYRDHRRLFQLDLDREEFLDFTRPLLTMRSAAVSIELLATRGERLALMRFTLTMEDETVGPSAIDSLLLCETDERGDIAAYDRWDLEDEDAAWDAIEARWKAGEGAQSSNLLAAREFDVALERRDWDAAAACYAPDFVGHDHRLVSWGTLHGPTAFVRALQEMVALAPDVRMRTNHRRDHGRGVIRDITWLGTRDGGAFESPFVTVTEIGAAGRVVRADFYDPHHLDRALARFEEIRASERRVPLEAVVKPNLAMESMLRGWIAFDEVDLDAADEALVAARAAFAPDFVWEDRRPVVGLSGGIDLMIASARERLASGARHERRTIVGTAGDRVAIARVLWAGGPPEGRFEVEFLVVHEVDEAGLCTAAIFFEPEDTRGAQREAWSRWAAIDPAVAPWLDLLSEVTDAWNGRDRAALRARFADDFVVEDHRLTGIGRIEGAEAYVDANAVLWDLAPDQRVEFDASSLTFDRHGLVATLRRAGTLADGGAFENEYVWLTLARDGRVTHLELFEAEQRDAALARFEALRPDPLRIPPNAATRAHDLTRQTRESGDKAALRSLVTDDFLLDDRSRRSQLRGGVEEWLRGIEFFRTESRARLETRVVATAGDRLVLNRACWRQSPGESSFLIERLHVIEIDAAGKLRAFVIFDAEDLAAAHAELFERYVALGADGMPACAIEFARAIHARDLGRVRAVLADDFVYHDRRRTGAGRLDGPDAYLESPRAWWELSEDGRMDMLYSAVVAPHGRVTLNRIAGRNLEGGDFESFLVVLAWTRGDRVAGVEVFEVDDLDAALARLEELRPDPLPLPQTAATRMRDRHRDAFVARDWDAVRALAGADFVYDDRGRRALVRGNVEAWIASMQYTTQPGFRSESALIGTLGDRIVLDQLRWFGKPDGDAFEFERVRLLEVGADGLLRAVLFFDPEDRFAASVEGLARFAAGEAAGSAGIAPMLAFSRALQDRDWDAARDCYAPDAVLVDHRPLSFGALDRDAWIAALRANDDLSVGLAWDLFRVLAWNEQGCVVGIRRRGTIPDGGGAYENELFSVALVTGGRVARYELFEETDAERAVARFEELCASGAS